MSTARLNDAGDRVTSARSVKGLVGYGRRRKRTRPRHISSESWRKRQAEIMREWLGAARRSGVRGDR